MRATPCGASAARRNGIEGNGTDLHAASGAPTEWRPYRTCGAAQKTVGASLCGRPGPQESDRSGSACHQEKLIPGDEAGSEVKMRILTFIFLLLISSDVTGQETEKEKDKWQRVYTYEDSVIEMNAAKVTFVNNDIGRVVFRTVWSKSQNLREKPGLKFKTRLETIEFKCGESRYRIYQVTLLDSKDKTVESYEMDQNEEWKTPKPGGSMERLMGFGCRLVLEKKRNP